MTIQELILALPRDTCLQIYRDYVDYMSKRSSTISKDEQRFLWYLNQMIQVKEE